MAQYTAMVGYTNNCRELLWARNANNPRGLLFDGEQVLTRVRDMGWRLCEVERLQKILDESTERDVTEDKDHFFRVHRRWRRAEGIETYMGTRRKNMETFTAIGNKTNWTDI